MIELALDARAVGADLDEIANQLLHVREIGADLIDLRALSGRETGAGRRRRRRRLRVLIEMKERPDPGRQAGGG